MLWNSQFSINIWDDGTLFFYLQMAFYATVLDMLNMFTAFFSAGGRIYDDWSPMVTGGFHTLDLPCEQSIWDSNMQSILSVFWYLVLMYRFWVVNCICQQSFHQIRGGLPFLYQAFLEFFLLILIFPSLLSALLSN